MQHNYQDSINKLTNVSLNKINDFIILNSWGGGEIPGGQHPTVQKPFVYDHAQGLMMCCFLI